MKAKLSVSGTLEEPIIGLLDNNLRGRELLDCPLHLPILNKLSQEIPALLKRCRIPPYDIAKRRGELKGVILVTNAAETEVILRFVLRSTEAIPRIRKALPEWQQQFAELKVVSANIQTVPHAILEGPEEVLLTEKQFITENYNGTNVFIGPQSFVQVTHQTASELYALARKIVQEVGACSLWDLYCGVGGFSLSCASILKSVVGVERSINAITCARDAATTQGLAQCTFVASDVEKFLNDESGQSPDLILLNPPRAGLREQVLNLLLSKHSAQHILISSCHPETLQRDLLRLHSKYEIRDLWPFDMFPLTAHMEVLALLQKR